MTTPPLPPPGSQPSPEPPPEASAWQTSELQKRKVWPWIVFPLIAVFVLAVSGFGFLAYIAYREIKKPIDATNNFLAAVKDVDSEAAAKLTCNGTAQNTDVVFARILPEEDLSPVDGNSGIASINKLESYDITEGRIYSKGDYDAATAGEITIADQKIDAVFFLDKQDGKYRVCDGDTGAIDDFEDD